MSKPKVYYEVKKISRRYANGRKVEGYTTQLHSRGRIRKIDFTHHMKEYYGIKRNDLKGVLACISGTIIAMALEGYNVNVPYLGSFKLYANASTETEKSKAGSRAIKGLKLRLRPSVELRRYLDKDGCIYLEWPGEEPDNKA